jgi:hypothetical protein
MIFKSGILYNIFYYKYKNIKPIYLILYIVFKESFFEKFFVNIDFLIIKNKLFI